MTDEMNDKTFREKVLESVSDTPVRVVPISFPKKTYKRFAKWSEENAGNCYWLAFEKLLDKEEFVSKEELGMILNELYAKISDLENKLQTKENEPKTVKTFGRKEE